MSVYCGRCGKIIHFSRWEKWTTNPVKPELGCQDCDPFYSQCRE